MSQLDFNTVNLNSLSNLIIVPAWCKAEIEAIPKDYNLESVQKSIRDNKHVADKAINLCVDFMSIVAQLEEARAQIKKYEDVKREAEAKTLNVIGDASKAMLSKDCVITCRLINRAKHRVPATSFITLTIKKGV